MITLDRGISPLDAEVLQSFDTFNYQEWEGDFIGLHDSNY